MRRIKHAVVALSVACAATGCSVYDDLTTSDFAKQDGDAIVAAASEAMLDVQSMRITGQARTNGNQFFLDLRLDRDDNCIGTVRFGGSSSNIDIRRVGDRVWLKGESGAYNRLSSTPLPRYLLDRLSTTWVLFEDDEDLRKACDLESFLESFEVVDLVAGDADTGKGTSSGKGRGKGKDRTDDLSGEVPTVVGDESSEDGQKVVQLSGSPGGQHDELAWVRSEAPHHVVRIESTSMQDGGTIAFSEFDEEFEVEVPKGKDVMRR
jgi:hypothetical protein